MRVDAEVELPEAPEHQDAMSCARICVWGYVGLSMSR